jgi:hypothetical protein
MVRMSGTGFNSTVSVDINLDKTAGRLNMWASAVKAVRKDLKIKVPNKGSKIYEKAALSASRAWGRYYSSQTEEWRNTIEARLQKTGNFVAPFWSILNYGTVSLASDRGGYPTPKNTKTNFVDAAEREIKLTLRGLFDTAKENFNAQFEQYNEFLAQELERRDRLDQLVDRVRFERSVVRQLEKSLDYDVTEINRNKLEKEVDNVRRGLLQSGRVSIGSGRRKTLSVNVIKEFLTQYG